MVWYGAGFWQKIKIARIVALATALCIEERAGIGNRRGGIARMVACMALVLLRKQHQILPLLLKRRFGCESLDVRNLSTHISPRRRRPYIA